MYQVHFQRRWLDLGLERCFGFQWLCNKLSKKIAWLKNNNCYSFTHHSVVSAGVAEMAHLCSTWHLLAEPSKIVFLFICLAPRVGLTKHHPLSVWSFQVASMGFLSSWWPQSCQTFYNMASFPKMQEQKFSDLLSIWAQKSQTVISTIFYHQSSHRGSPASRGGDCTGREC